MKLGVVMDPIHTIKVGHDSTLALLTEAQQRGWTVFYFEPQDLFIRDGVACGSAKLLKVSPESTLWFHFEDEMELALADLDLILMRKDPPFNKEYLYLTQILDLAEKAGVLVVNKPQALRDANEKLAITFFPECTAPTLVARKISQLKTFLEEEKNIVCKPLDAMGGASIFRLSKDDPNATVVFEGLTRLENRHIMVQRFIPEITAGDKRILLLEGEPVTQVLARVPQKGDWRGNMAVGAKPLAQPLSSRDQEICEKLSPWLREKGIYFAGIDVIGAYLTEINVTSPTGICELDKLCHLNISKLLFDRLEKHL